MYVAISKSFGLLFPIAILVCAYSNIDKSFVLSPIAKVFSNGIFNLFIMYSIHVDFE